MPSAAKRYALPPKVEAELAAWCKANGDDPEAVIADLVEAFLDDLVAEAEALDLAMTDGAPPPGAAGRGQALVVSDVLR